MGMANRGGGGLSADGSAWFWGDNTTGALGNQSTSNFSSPVSVIGAHSFIEITSSYENSFGLKADGSVWSWGGAADGLLGNNSGTNVSSPVSVVGNHSFIYIRAAGMACYGLKITGDVWNWGYYAGLGSNTFTVSSPVSVVGAHSFIAIAASGDKGQGHDTGYGLKVDGSAWAWGFASNGALGNDTTTATSSPISIVGNHSFIAIAGGSENGFALKIDGSAWSWGVNANGAIGNDTANNYSSPVSVVGAHSFVKIVAGGDESGTGGTKVYALKIDGSCWGWGVNYIGNNTGNNFSSPVSIVGAHSFIQIYAGSAQGYGLKASGQVWAWGTGTSGAVGNNTITTVSSPVLVVGSLGFGFLPDIAPKLVNNVVSDIEQDTRFKILSVQDINNDVRFKELGLDDINQDVRFKILSVQDVKQDVRFKEFSVQDINNDFRMVEPQLDDVNQDVRFKILSVSDVNNDVRFYNGITVDDIEQDVRFKELATKDIRCDVRFTNHPTVQYDIKEDIRFRYALAVYDIKNDVRFKQKHYSDVKNDFRMSIGGLGLYDIVNDVRIEGVFFKQFYANVIVTVSSEKEFYSNIASVSLGTAIVPTGLTAIDLQKGDLIQTAWNPDANYGYNVYTTAPGPRTKRNQTPITDAFLVGNLITETPYTFVVVGVTGGGVESADSVPVVATPTFPASETGSPRIINYTLEFLWNDTPFTNVIVDSVEIGYGTTPSIARFTIPVTSGGVYPVDNDSIEVIVNSRSIFKGIVKNIVTNVSAGAYNYQFIAYSRAILYTYSSVTWDYILQIRENYNIDVSDQNQLQAFQTVADFKGNYKMYYNMQNDTFIEYELGTGNVIRTVIIGTNVIDYNLTTDTISKVDKIMVRGARRKYRTNWAAIGFGNSIFIGIQGSNPQWVKQAFLTKFNLGDIQVEAFQSQGSPQINYNTKQSIIPTDVPSLVQEQQFINPSATVTWLDGTVEPKQLVTGYFDPVVTWRSCGVKIIYKYEAVGNEAIPISATLDMTSFPTIVTSFIQTFFNVVRKGRPGMGEDINIGTASIALANVQNLSPFRVSYTYTDVLPYEVSYGSGPVSRTITDTQYAPFDDYLNNGLSYLNPQEAIATIQDTAFVTAQMLERAQAELMKVNQPVTSGRIKIVGDETMDLMQMVNINGTLLDIIRITHDFSKGFTTELELTNEKFRINVLPYVDLRARIEFETKVGNTTYFSHIALANQVEQNQNTEYNLQSTILDIPKGPFALYGD